MKGKGKNKGKGKGKEKGKDKGNAKSRTSRRKEHQTRRAMKCFFCKERGHARKDFPKFSAWLAGKKTVGHEQSANSIEEDGWIFALDHEAWGAVRADHHRQLCVSSRVSTWSWPRERTSQIEWNETIVDGIRSGNETARNETGELRHRGWKDHDGLPSDRSGRWGPLMDSGCDVHCTKNHCWISKDDGKELDTRPSKSTSKEASMLELNPMTAAEVEQAALAREHAAFGTPGPTAGATLGGDGEHTVRINGTGNALSWRESAARGFGTRALSKLVSMVHRRAADKPHLRCSNQKQMKPCQAVSLTSRISDERRIKCCPFLPSMQSMLAPRCQQHFVPRKHSVSI